VVDAPIHKDFHAGHVLIGQDVYVLDLDEARLGDPALDLAHFCTCLEAVAGSVAAGPMTSAFMDEYVAVTGWSDAGSLASYCAHTWLKVAKQITVGSGPFRDTPPEEHQRLVVAAVTRGLACLDA
jgi:aminoglycoside phosphotransferase (APT) family kinase protein